MTLIASFLVQALSDNGGTICPIIKFLITGLRTATLFSNYERFQLHILVSYYSRPKANYQKFIVFSLYGCPTIDSVR